MKSLSLLSSSDSILYLDTSVLINLIATDQVEEIARALSCRMIIERAVIGELTRDPRDGRDGRVVLAELIQSGVFSPYELNDDEGDLFLKLVGAQVPDDLGDGEAATIACGVGKVGRIVIDEKKARRIIARAFSHITPLCTLDLLCSDRVRSKMGERAVATCVHNAIAVGKMRVPAGWKALVEELIRRFGLSS